MKPLFVTGAFCLLFASAVDAADTASRPNILLVLSDDHSVPHVGCYGNSDIRTPNLDRFAAEGLRFDRAYVACPQCVPSRAAIFTGRSPIAIGMTRFSATLPAEIKIFPEILRGEGYYAGVAGRTYHMDGSRQSPESERVLEKYHLRTFPQRLDFVKTGGRAQMLAQFRAFLDAVPAGKPFVLQLCSNDPHRPLDRNAVPQPHDPAKLKLPVHYPDTPLVRDDFARYYDEIARFDSDFGQVLSELSKRHVPLVARWPGKVKPRTNTSVLISGEDLAPTFLEAAGVAVPRDMTGKGFLRLLKGESFEGRQYVFSERGAHGGGLPTNSAAFDLGRCVITKKHKLIYNALWQIPYAPVDFAGDPMWKELQQMNKDGKLSPELAKMYFSPTRPMFELYDLESDPAELNNLAGKNEFAKLERGLKAELLEWMVRERDFVPLPIPPQPQ
jgi:arylsulfatase A-like enzyme